MKTGRPSNCGTISRRAALKTAGGAIAAAVAAPRWASAQTPKRGGTLRVSNGGDPPDFDVHQSATYLTQFVGAPCYSTLLRADPRDYNRLVADLAEKWDISPDGKTREIKIAGSPPLGLLPEPGRPRALR